jgi:O-antigen/teichoic acid export membrane protein
VVFIIVSSREIMALIYGPTYEAAYIFLSIQSLIYFLVGFGYLTLTSLYNGLGETRTTLKMSLITFLTLLFLSPLLTGFFGVPGMIVAFLIANGLGVSYGSYVAKKKFQITFDNNSTLKIYLVSFLSCIPAIVLNLTSLPLLVKVAGGAVLTIALYLTLIPITRILYYSELSALREITRKIKGLSFIAKPVLKYQEVIFQKINMSHMENL